MNYIDAYAFIPGLSINGKKLISTNEGIFFSIIFYFLSSLVLIYNFYNVYKENNPIVLTSAKIFNTSSVELIPSNSLDFGITLVMLKSFPKVNLQSIKHRDIYTLNSVTAEFSGLYSTNRNYEYGNFNQNSTLSGNFTSCNGKYGNHTLLANSYCTNYISQYQEIGGNLVDVSFLKEMNTYINHHYCDLLLDTTEEEKFEIPDEYKNFLKLINKNLSSSEKEYLDTLNLPSYKNLSDLQYIYPFKNTPYLSDENSIAKRNECLKLFSGPPQFSQNSTTNNQTNIESLIVGTQFIYGVSYANKILNTDLYEGYEEVVTTKYFPFTFTEEALLINFKLIKNIVITDDNLFFQFGENRKVEFYEIEIIETRNSIDKSQEMYLPITVNFSINDKIIQTNRSYNKIDTVLANCFSIIKVFYSVLFFFMMLLEEKLVYKEIIKNIYFEREIKLDENFIVNSNILKKENNGQNKLKKLNQISQKMILKSNDPDNPNKSIKDNLIKMTTLKKDEEIKLNKVDIDIHTENNNSKLKLIENEAFKNNDNKIKDINMKNNLDSKKKKNVVDGVLRKMSNTNKRNSEKNLEEYEFEGILSNRMSISVNHKNKLDSISDSVDKHNKSGNENDNLNIKKKHNSHSHLNSNSNSNSKSISNANANLYYNQSNINNENPNIKKN